MKEGRILKEADVYFELKDRLRNSTPNEAEEFLKDLHRHGMFYARFVEPTRETDPAVSERLDRLRRLKFTVAYPFLLRIFDGAANGELTSRQLLEALDILETFLIRRSVCGYPTNQLRRMLPPVFDAARGRNGEFIEGLRYELGGVRCPDDEVFVRALETESMYSTAEKNVRVKLILERLERSYDHKEPADVSSAQIEHIMPQTITDEWARELGEGWEEESQRLLHTLGNLTLTRYNPELSNKPYAAKRAEFASSHYCLNSYFQTVERWPPAAIRERGRTLAQRALGIWCDLGRAKELPEAKKQTLPPVKIRFREVSRPVRRWREAFIALLKEFESTDPGLLARIAKEQKLSAVIGFESNRFPRSKAQIGGVFVNTHASADSFQDWCRRVARLASIPESDYEFVMRDETPTREVTLLPPD